MKARHIVNAVAALAVLVPGRAPAAEPSPADERAPVADDYRIGPEDQLSISVWKNPELTRTVPVRPDGKISLPLLNDIQAAGLTPMELREVIRQQLSEFVTAPEVSVIVEGIHSFKVSIIGSVSQSGRFELGSPTTVLDALAMAGGFTEFSSPENIFILRVKDKMMTRVHFNYRRVIASGGESQNFYLQPGDIIVVP